MGQEQRLAAAQLAYGRLAQPMDFWGSVLPAALKPLQAAEFSRLAAPWLTAVDRSNLTGRYVLNLGRPLDRRVLANKWRGGRQRLCGACMGGDKAARLLWTNHVGTQPIL
jgi:hypothetical protein